MTGSSFSPLIGDDDGDTFGVADTDVDVDEKLVEFPPDPREIPSPPCPPMLPLLSMPRSPAMGELEDSLVGLDNTSIWLRSSELWEFRERTCS